MSYEQEIQIKKACESGDVKKVFNLRNKYNFEYGGDCLELAIKNGHLNVVSIICDHWKVIPSMNNEMCKRANMYWCIGKAMKYNQKEIELYIKKRIGIDSETPKDIIEKMMSSDNLNYYYCFQSNDYIR